MTRYAYLAAVLPMLFLAGCTDADWDHALRYTGVGQDTVAADEPVPGAQPAAAMPVAAAMPPSIAQTNTEFCTAVAKQDAAGDGFDDATQTRMFQRSFQQCVTLFATAAPRDAVAAN